VDEGPFDVWTNHFCAFVSVSASLLFRQKKTLIESPQWPFCSLKRDERLGRAQNYASVVVGIR